ncbi:hypothetical protein NE237_009884 [Protea cynaroides]|uniref:Uncharacterized protein n=1 Tax=Protea cynaroides TaxID=273540 RepID=A0A9Q0KZF4_9MAGN|nr:hypothetical protein NE237_009884 [Protea cynaroides]
MFMFRVQISNWGWIGSRGGGGCYASSVGIGLNQSSEHHGLATSSMGGQFSEVSPRSAVDGIETYAGFQKVGLNGVELSDKPENNNSGFAQDGSPQTNAVLQRVGPVLARPKNTNSGTEQHVISSPISSEQSIIPIGQGRVVVVYYDNATAGDDSLRICEKYSIESN